MYRNSGSFILCNIFLSWLCVSILQQEELEIILPRKTLEPLTVSGVLALWVKEEMADLAALLIFMRSTSIHSSQKRWKLVYGYGETVVITFVCQINSQSLLGSVMTVFRKEKRWWNVLGGFSVLPVTDLNYYSFILSNSIWRIQKASLYIFTNKLMDTGLKQCTLNSWEGNRNKRLSFELSMTRETHVCEWIFSQ